MANELSEQEVAAVHTRVDFDLALKRVRSNHFSFDECSFKGVNLLQQPEWVGQVAEALVENTTCKTLVLSECGLTDGALQQLAATLAVPTRCPNLRRLDLRGNPALTPVGETVAQGLARLRTGLEVAMGDGLDAKREGFAHDKQVIVGLTAWTFDELKVPGSQNDLYCPIEISGEGKERIEMKRGFQGPNGTKYKCDLATFEVYHQTGNVVLLSLASEEKPGIEV